jgi:hypothetical protein
MFLEKYFNYTIVINRNIYKALFVKFIMKDSCNPRIGEVFEKLISKESHKIKSNLKNLTSSLSGTVLYLNLLPYVIPSVFRNGKKFMENHESSVFSALGFACGFVGGIAGVCAQGVYGKEFIKNPDNLFSFLALTNGASLIYEAGRFIKNKYKETKQKIINEQKNRIKESI